PPPRGTLRARPNLPGPPAVPRSLRPRHGSHGPSSRWRHPDEPRRPWPLGSRRPLPVTDVDGATARGSTGRPAAVGTVPRRSLQPHRPRATPHWTGVTVPGPSMRVLMIAHGFRPAVMGGTEIYTHDLARTLHEAFGDDVHILTREADAARPEYAVRRE